MKTRFKIGEIVNTKHGKGEIMETKNYKGFTRFLVLLQNSPLKFNPVWLNYNNINK